MNDIFEAHKYSINNMPALKNDDICGCFYCLKIFNPNEITDIILDTKETAICPYCGIDSIIGKSSGFPITKEFLRLMQKYWFNS